MNRRGGSKGGMISVLVVATVVAVVLGLAGQSLPDRLRDAVATPPSPEPEWVERLAAVDDALATGNPRQAAREWPDAYGAAFRSRRWDALLQVGDRATRISELLQG